MKWLTAESPRLDDVLIAFLTMDGSSRVGTLLLLRLPLVIVEMIYSSHFLTSLAIYQ